MKSKVKTKQSKKVVNNLKNHISIRIGDTEKIKKKSNKTESSKIRRYKKN